MMYCCSQNLYIFVMACVNNPCSSARHMSGHSKANEKRRLVEICCLSNSLCSRIEIYFYQLMVAQYIKLVVVWVKNIECGPDEKSQYSASVWMDRNLKTII